MIHYIKADLFKINKEHRLTLSLGILLLLSFLSAFLLHGNEDYTSSLIQLLSQFITLFFIVPANLFFGEDFSNRTINNILIKNQTRSSIFLYKTLSTIILNLIYIGLAYIFSSWIGLLLGEQVDFYLIWQSFISQIPLFICLSLLSIFLFVKLNKINQSHLSFILASLLFDNIAQLTISNLLHINPQTDYFLFLSLQKGSDISSLSKMVSFIFILIYTLLSYHIFKNKEFK